MGCTSDAEATRSAALFAQAAAAFASEAVLAVSRLGRQHVPTPAANRALALAAETAEDLERRAREGADLAEAYRLAATALQAAAVALSETKPRPWVHHVRPPRVVPVLMDAPPSPPSDAEC